MIDRPGVARYRLELIAADDRVPENNSGTSAVRVEAPAAILLVNASGGPDNLSRALAAGKLNVQTVTPESLPRDVAGLLAFRAVILENVPASDVGLPSLTALTRFATDLGGGLMLTGGGGAFGVGGYFKSVLDPYLPGLDGDQERTPQALARDGRGPRSLGKHGDAGRRRPPEDGSRQSRNVRGDRVPGAFRRSGRDCRGQRTAYRQSADARGRHTGASATACVASSRWAEASSCTPRWCRRARWFRNRTRARGTSSSSRTPQTRKNPATTSAFSTRMRQLGITVSVIGLGSELDKDAAFLKDVAQRGDGRIQFTASVDELPRLFAQEAITVARSSFVDAPTATHAVSDMVLLGDLPKSRFSEHRWLQPQLSAAWRNGGRAH